VCSITAEVLIQSNTPLQVCAEAFDPLEGNEKEVLLRFEALSKSG
jgi:hypothetical protein